MTETLSRTLPNDSQSLGVHLDHQHDDSYCHLPPVQERRGSRKSSTGSTKISRTIPTDREIAQLHDYELFDKDSQSLTFSSLYASSEKVLVLFIRHFFCGMCQDYIRALAASNIPQQCNAHTPSIPIIIIGCGSPELISGYAKSTPCPFPIYADPRMELFHTLGLGRSLAKGPKNPDYATKSFMSLTLDSLMQALKSGKMAFKAGDFSQLGGEFIFQTKPDDHEGTTVTWCHRMEHTRDHVGLPELEELLGLSS